MPGMCQFSLKTQSWLAVRLLEQVKIVQQSHFHPQVFRLTDRPPRVVVVAVLHLPLWRRRVGSVRIVARHVRRQSESDGTVCPYILL